MIVRLCRTAEGPIELSFVRSDGSATMRAVSPLFVEHELMHYAVESVLGIDHGMMGLIADGRDVADFDAAARNWLPLEAHHAEIIVGALEAELNGSADPADFSHNVRAICEDVGVPNPAEIPALELDRIRREFQHLKAEWRGLADGGVLELPWQAASPPAQ